GRLSYQFSSDGYIRRSVYAYELSTMVAGLRGYIWLVILSNFKSALLLTSWQWLELRKPVYLKALLTVNRKNGTWTGLETPPYAVKAWWACCAKKNEQPPQQL
ncbi:hypothetical protein, partial [Escherichia coli]|uniref:hypothetical protein n=1 Tax=Escherichia coli TaxID=562 RepID=UPI001BC89F16